MLNEQQIINDYKSGKTMKQIAQDLHVIVKAISDIIKPLGLPNASIINRIKDDLELKKFFIDTYNSTDNVKELCIKLKQHPYFTHISNNSIHQRMCEIRNYYEDWEKQLSPR